jgi:hypothetical protein
MKIGRRIYYNTSGEVIIDTGERMGNVIETSRLDDEKLYPITPELLIVVIE